MPECQDKKKGATNYLGLLKGEGAHRVGARRNQRRRHATSGGGRKLHLIFRVKRKGRRCPPCPLLRREKKKKKGTTASKGERKKTVFYLLTRSGGERVFVGREGEHILLARQGSRVNRSQEKGAGKRMPSEGALLREGTEKGISPAGEGKWVVSSFYLEGEAARLLGRGDESIRENFLRLRVADWRERGEKKGATCPRGNLQEGESVAFTKKSRSLLARYVEGRGRLE